MASNLLEYPGLLVTLLASPALPGRVVGSAILSGLLLAVAARRRWPQPVAWHTSGLLLVACVSVLPSLLVKPKAVYALPIFLLTLIGSDNFRKYPGIRQDPEFARFESDPASFGFRLVLSNPRYAFFLRTSRD